jgi:predicted DsbA family dithiol-disulfide isomerase
MEVQIISDVVCPWCRIGKVNLRTAAVQWTEETGEEVHMTFLPFLLDPIRPDELGEGFRERFTKRKGMAPEQIEGMFAQVTQAGARYGLHYDFSKVKVAVDTVPAHEFMELVPEDRREALMDAMMEQYFEHGANIGDIDVLLGIGRQIGIPQDELNAIEPALRNRRLEKQVRGMIQQVQQAGVQGVPFFILNGRLAVQGGQPPEVFLDALRQAKAAELSESVETGAKA